MWTGELTFQNKLLFFCGPSKESTGLGAWQRRRPSQGLCDPGQVDTRLPRCHPPGMVSMQSSHVPVDVFRAGLRGTWPTAACLRLV